MLGFQFVARRVIPRAYRANYDLASLQDNIRWGRGAAWIGPELKKYHQMAFGIHLCFFFRLGGSRFRTGLVGVSSSSKKLGNKEHVQ